MSSPTLSAHRPRYRQGPQWHLGTEWWTSSSSVKQLPKSQAKQTLFHHRAAAKDFLRWLTAVIRLICTSRTDTDVLPILIAFPVTTNRKMPVTGWADMLDFCV